MIPPFTDFGYLPIGLHPATVNEIEELFGQGSELRQVQMESFRWLVDLARQAGVQRIAVNGSFVTNIPTPNDVDCALLIGPEYPKDVAAAKQLTEGLPFIQMYLVEQEGYDYFVQHFFATDRDNIPKGMLEVIP